MPRQWIRDHDYDFLDPEYYGRDIDDDPDAVHLQDARDVTDPGPDTLPCAACGHPDMGGHRYEGDIFWECETEGCDCPGFIPVGRLRSTPEER